MCINYVFYIPMLSRHFADLYKKKLLFTQKIDKIGTWKTVE